MRYQDKKNIIKKANPSLTNTITSTGIGNASRINGPLHEIAKTLNPSNSQSLCVAFFINFVFPSNEITASLTLEEMQF